MLMAARLRQTHQDDVKKKIQGSHLLKLLQDHALTGKHNGVEVNASRIDAAKFLLNKIVGNPPTEVSGPDGGPLIVEIVRFADSNPA